MVWQVPLVVTVLVSWLGSPSGSLGEVAQKEAVRRHLSAPPSVSVSNDTLPLPRANDIRAAPVAAVAAPVSGEGEDDEPLAGVGDPSQKDAVPGDSEKVWRSRAADARAAIVRDDARIVELEGRVALLEREAASRDDPAQRAVIRGDLVQALADLDRARRTLEADRRASDRLKEDARRADVPAGWLR